LADAVAALYSERSLLKYDAEAEGYRFGDVIDLVHPTPAADKPWYDQALRMIPLLEARVGATWPF
jgi:hypothetical protein